MKDFDLIFLLKDPQDPEIDAMVSDHVMSTARSVRSPHSVLSTPATKRLKKKTGRQRQLYSGSESDHHEDEGAPCLDLTGSGMSLLERIKFIKSQGTELLSSSTIGSLLKAAQSTGPPT